MSERRGDEIPPEPSEESEPGSEEAPSRFKRLLNEGPPAGRPKAEEAEPPFRHPTGEPELTGGWMADESPLADETVPTEEDLQGTNPEGAQVPPTNPTPAIPTPQRQMKGMLIHPCHGESRRPTSAQLASVRRPTSRRPSRPLRTARPGPARRAS
jgi:hypothetical protein